MLFGCSSEAEVMGFNKLKQIRSFPEFHEIENDFSHSVGNLDNDHEVLDLLSFQPFDDGVNAVMVTGGRGQHNSVYIYDKKNNELVDIAKRLGLEGELDVAKYGIAIGDLTGNNFDDIIIAQSNGVYIYKRNSYEGMFIPEKLDFELPNNAVALDVELADVDGNGLLDVYISTFLDKKKLKTASFKDPVQRVNNVFLKNMGDGHFVDESNTSGIGIHQNTFMSKFVDLNNNGYPDLIPALNTSQIKIYENNKNGTFTEHTLTEGYGFWMGISVSDLNGSGYKDILFTNVGTSIPKFLLRGDLNKKDGIDRNYHLFRHKGDFQFYDVSQEYGLNFKNFGWGAQFIDFDNTGLYQDLYITENYTHFPFNLHKYFPKDGSLFLEDDSGRYKAYQSELNVKNPYFGYRVLAVDITGNGLNDLVIANLKGPLRVFGNK
ncbi:hypothetical protein CWN98_09100 [Vibrio splendidus]|nr:hypothetical protein CWN98_09100 [Vibrio splendidus]PTP46752.1 hypothetical protein CWO10_14790 [Vibrio splendidus]